MATMKFNGHSRRVHVVSGPQARKACDSNLLAPAPVRSMSGPLKKSSGWLVMLLAAVGLGKGYRGKQDRRVHG
jgi:hypothetical protein